MQVIGFFGNLLQQFGALWTWINEPLKVFEDMGLPNVSIFVIMSAGIVTILGVCLTLHIIHLVNPVG